MLFREFSDEWSTYIPPLGFDTLLSKPELAALLEARWAESERASKAEAFVSATVVLGSILEGVLVDMCYRFPKLAGNAKSRKKDSRGKNLPFEEWHLDCLIDIAYECKWIAFHTREQSKSLRQYRNIIHPQEQLKLGYYPNKDTCSLSREVVTVALGDIRRWIREQAGLNPNP